MVNPLDLAVLRIDGFMMRPIQAVHLDALAAIWADPEVTRFLPSRGSPISRQNVEKSIQSFVGHWQERGYGIWAILPEATSQMIGYCGLRYLNELDEVEVLYGLARTYWGRGITTQAVKAAIAYGFDDAHLEKIIAMAFAENHASRRVMEKAGLRYEKHVHIWNLDALYYSITPLMLAAN